MKMTGKYSLHMLGILAVIGFCCIALVSPVAAIYPNDKWITDGRTVLANISPYATINGVSFTNAYFFGITGNGHYNITAPAWNWTTDSRYSDRYYMEQWKVANATGDHWYPDPYVGGEWQWEFVDDLTMDATIFKKGLGWYVDPGDETYYAWYGNKSAAFMTYNGHTNWLVPTYENATYLAELPVDW
jgi:hypothetical protein